MLKHDDPPSKLTIAILAADAIVLLVLFVSISATSGTQAVVLTPDGSRVIGNGQPRGVETVMWLLLVPLGLALAAMVYVGVREMIGSRHERHAFEHRPVEEQQRLHHAGSAMQSVSTGAPAVADRLASRKQKRRLARR